MADTTHLESELSSMNMTTTTTKEEGPASLSQHVSIILSTIYGMRAIQQQIIVIIVGIVLTLFLSLGRQHSYDRSLPLASWQDWNPWCRGHWPLHHGASWQEWNPWCRGSGKIFQEKFAPVVATTTGANFSPKISPLPLASWFVSTVMISGSVILVISACSNIHVDSIPTIMFKFHPWPQAQGSRVL